MYAGKKGTLGLDLRAGLGSGHLEEMLRDPNKTSADVPRGMSTNAEVPYMIFFNSNDPKAPGLSLL